MSVYLAQMLSAAYGNESAKPAMTREEMLDEAVRFRTSPEGRVYIRNTPPKDVLDYFPVTISSICEYFTRIAAREAKT